VTNLKLSFISQERHDGAVVITSVVKGTLGAHMGYKIT
jgi:hypothetical protein